MDSLRKPILFLAVALIAIVVLIEVGSSILPQNANVNPQALRSDLPDSPAPTATAVAEAFGKADQDEINELGEETPPGLGIPYMALLDAVLLFTVALIVISLVLPEGVHGRIQGCGTLIFSLLIILGGLVMIFVALGLVMIMVSLLLSVPWGTIAYLVIFGHFDRQGAGAILVLLMMLKLGFAVALIVANPRFLQNKGLVLLVLTSLLANVILSFLHGFVPVFLVSITDGIGAIIMGLLACIWAIILLVGGIVSLVKVIGSAT